MGQNESFGSGRFNWQMAIQDVMFIFAGTCKQIIRKNIPPFTEVWNAAILTVRVANDVMSSFSYQINTRNIFDG